MFVWGTRGNQWTVTHQGQQKTLVLRYSYFSIIIAFSIAWGEQWFLLSDKRSEDVRLTKEQVAMIFQPEKPPGIHPWEKYSLPALIVIFMVIGALGNI